MLHKLSVAGRPRFGEPEILRPARAADRAVGDVFLAGGHLVFTEGGGVWIERAADREDGSVGAGRAELLLADGDGRVHLSPRPAGSLIGVHRSVAGSAPPKTESIVFVDPKRSAAFSVPGQAFGASGDVALVADMDAHLLRRVDLRTRESREVGPLAGELEQQLRPIISLDPTGGEALYMDASGGEASLWWLDLSSGRRERLVGPLPEPSWVRGTFAPDGGALVQQMLLDEPGLFRLLHFARGSPAREILRLPICQPDGAPAFLSREWALLLLSVKAHALTDYGPVDLVAVPLAGGALVPVTQRGDLRRRVRMIGDAAVVEGADRIVRVPVLR